MKNEYELYKEFEEAFLDGEFEEEEFKQNVINNCLSKFNRKVIHEFFYFCDKFNLEPLSKDELDDLYSCEYITIDDLNSKYKQYNY